MIGEERKTNVTGRICPVSKGRSLHDHPENIMRKLLLWACALIIVLQPLSASPAKDKVQIALLLDTSNSMDGLIDQARTQLWKIVDGLSTATKNGQQATLEIGLYEYGNTMLAANTGFLRQVCAFTTDLDLVSERLFELKTNGGDEYCPTVIVRSVQDLAWSTQKTDLRLIVIAGNEPFAQGKITPDEACKAAKAKDITITTLYCGSDASGKSEGWQTAALCAGGAYFAVNTDKPVHHISTPYDTTLSRLNTELNNTYVGYGNLGATKKQRQVAQDANASGKGLAVMAQRAKAKSTQHYKNSDWDIVDLHAESPVAALSVPEQQLPSELKSLSVKEREAKIKELASQRKKLQAEIESLSQQRNTFVAAEERKLSKDETTTIDKVMMSAIRKFAADRSFVL